MPKYFNIYEFADKLILPFPAENQKGSSPAPADTAYKIWVSWDEDENWVDKFQHFLALPDIDQTTALVVGPWQQEGTFEDPPDAIVQALVTARNQLPNLEAIYFGLIMSTEFEISWITNTDLSPLLTAYPKLKTFRVRGAGNLSLGGLNHPILEHLSIETGGLPRRILDEVLNHNLPNLRHLELWLGSRYYGFDFDLDALQPLFEGTRFPNLKTLALCDSEIQDDLARAIVDAPILTQLKVLDLSMGTLSDEGAQALLDAADRLKHLVRLDLSHHYCSDEMMMKMMSLPTEVIMKDQNQEDVYKRQDGTIARERYVAVSE